MPLARIITLHPERTSALSEQLQQQGFNVEVARPEETHIQPAELEIHFELCDQRQVLKRAAELAKHLGAEILVFPKAVEAPPKPASVEEIRRPEPVAVKPPVQELQRPEAVAAAPVFSSAVELPASARQNETPSQEEEFSYELPGQSGNFFTNLGSELRKSLQQAGAAFSGFRKDLGPVFSRTRTKLNSGVTELKGKASFTTESLSGTAREYQERLKLRAAQARAEREQRLAELERQRAEARQQAAVLEQEKQKERQLELERQRVEREQRLAELERQRIEAIERAAALQRERERQKEAVAGSLEPQFQMTEQPVPQQRPIPRPQSRTSRRKQSQLNGVLTGAIAISFLFLIGLTLSNFRPRSPLPADVAQPNVEQNVPFGAATIHAAPAQTRPVAQQPVQPQPQLQTPKPATRVAAQRPHPQRRHFRSHRSEGDDVADDVVVRHFNTQKPQPQHAQQARLKKYSDM